MADEYTPTTDEVRRFFTNGKSEEMCASSWDDAYAEEFDRWLIEHDRQVRAEALREAAREVDWQWEAFVASDGVTSIREHGKAPSELLNDRADRIVAGEGA